MSVLAMLVVLLVFGVLLDLKDESLAGREADTPVARISPLLAWRSLPALVV